MHIIAIINQKGGVGKSTTADAIGAGLQLRGNSVLYIDLDAQGNLSYAKQAEPAPTVYQVLTRELRAADAIQRTERASILASDPALSGADMAINMTGKEYRLREGLRTVQDFDYCIIDTPPALGILTVNALTACTGVIIPAQADVYSMHGIGQLYDTIQAVQQYCNPELTIMGIVLTRFQPRTIVSREITEVMADTARRFGTRLYQSRIRECVVIKEAQIEQTDIFTYAPRSNAAADYAALVDEIIGGGENE